MKVREEELARFYAAAAEDVRNATLSSTEGLIWTKKVREVLKCADLIPNLYYGRDPSELVQLAETRAPQLHDTILHPQAGTVPLRTSCT